MLLENTKTEVVDKLKKYKELKKLERQTLENMIILRRTEVDRSRRWVFSENWRNYRYRKHHGNTKTDLFNKQKPCNQGGTEVSVSIEEIIEITQNYLSLTPIPSYLKTLVERTANSKKWKDDNFEEDRSRPAVSGSIEAQRGNLLLSPSEYLGPDCYKWAPR